VRRARAAGKVEIRRAGRSEMLRIEEIASAQSAPVLQQYLKRLARGEALTRGTNSTGRGS